MDPKEYYYKNFRSEFNDFVAKTNIHEHRDEGMYIPIQDINKESLSHLDPKHRMLFLAALSCTVLIDQVMYTHFKMDYQKFQNLTKYPKFEYGITNINVNPWHIYREGRGLKAFKEFVQFFIEDLESFFSEYEFKEATWQKVSEAMLNDPDVGAGPFGRIFVSILEGEKPNI